MLSISQEGTLLNRDCVNCVIILPVDYSAFQFVSFYSSFLDCYIPFGVTGRVLEPWATNESPAGPCVRICACSRVPWQCTEGVLVPLPITTTHSKFCPHWGLNRQPSASQPSPLQTEYVQLNIQYINKPQQFSSISISAVIFSGSICPSILYRFIP